jgi:hypothetical protein
MSTKTKAVSVHGKDDFGRFIIGAGDCINCGVTGICVKYSPRTFSLQEWGLESPEFTILRDTKNRVGITCGCYGKFHRQVTHIYEKTVTKLLLNKKRA